MHALPLSDVPAASQDGTQFTPGGGAVAFGRELTWTVQ